MIFDSVYSREALCCSGNTEKEVLGHPFNCLCDEQELKNMNFYILNFIFLFYFMKAPQCIEIYVCKEDFPVTCSRMNTCVFLSLLCDLILNSNLHSVSTVT